MIEHTAHTKPPAIEVTEEDVKLWLDGVKNLASLESRRQTYRKQYNVDYKIRCAKRAGEWPPKPYEGSSENQAARYFCDLVDGLPVPAGFKTIQEYLGICHKTYMRYRTGATQPPRPTIILLEFLRNGDLGLLFGKDWEGMTIKGGKLFAPYWGWRSGFEPCNISYMFYGFQRLKTQLRETDRLESEIRRLESIADGVARGSPRLASKPALRLVGG